MRGRSNPTASIEAIPVPLVHVGSVNAWLLRGEPLTLVDTGPNDERAFAALEAGLARAGVRMEDVELVLATHHHLDHVGLAPAIRERSGATIAVRDRVADYASNCRENIERERRFSHRLMAVHGVPDEVVAEHEGFWRFLRDKSAEFDADVRLTDGDRVVAGGRTLDVVARPGHSPTDTLFVDAGARLAFAGDHLLADISSNTEVCDGSVGKDWRGRTRLEYLENLRRTAAMPVDVLLTGHGRCVRAPAELVGQRLAEHRERAAVIARLLLSGPQSAYDLARSLWSARTVREQALLVVWEVLGHLELLLAAGLARAVDDGDAGQRFELVAQRRDAA